MTPADAIRAHALRYLAARVTTAGHLRELLLRGAARRDPEGDRAAHATAADAVLAELIRSGALDDAAWARSRLASLRARGTSTVAARAHLRAKRVPPDVVDALLADEGEDARLVAALRHLRRRRLGPWGAPAGDGDARAALTKLARAGFPYAIAVRAVSMDPDEARERAGW